MDTIQPTMIAIPAPSFNQDHEAVYKAAITACRPHLAELKPFQKLVLVADSPSLPGAGLPSARTSTWTSATSSTRRAARLLEARVPAETFAAHGGPRCDPPARGDAGREISVRAAEAYECLRFVCEPGSRAAASRQPQAASRYRWGLSGRS